MQTILRVVFDNRGQQRMVDDYIAEFKARFTSETPASEFPHPGAGDVAFAVDDRDALRDCSIDQSVPRLGSFDRSLHSDKEKTQFIFVNPVIVSYRRYGPNLRLWVESPSFGKAGDTESE